MTAAQWLALKQEAEKYAAHRQKAAAATKKYRATERGKQKRRAATAAYRRRLVETYRAAQKETTCPAPSA